MSKLLPMPVGLIDPTLAADDEIETLRVDLQAASGSVAAAAGRGAAAGQVVSAVAAARHLSEMLAVDATVPMTARLVVQTADGQPFELALPVAWSAGMLQELAVLLSGESVAWQAASPENEVGTSEVATILGVSIPTATKVLDRGEIPSRVTPGGHRRVRRADAAAWRAKRDAQRASIHELVQFAATEERSGPALPSKVTEDPDDET